PPQQSKLFPYTPLFRSKPSAGPDKPSSPPPAAEEPSKDSASSNAADHKPHTPNGGGSSICHSPSPSPNTYPTTCSSRHSEPNARSEEHTSELQSRENLV